jgi:hypothetical protein
MCGRRCCMTCLGRSSPCMRTCSWAVVQALTWLRGARRQVRQRTLCDWLSALLLRLSSGIRRAPGSSASVRPCQVGGFAPVQGLQCWLRLTALCHCLQAQTMHWVLTAAAAASGSGLVKVCALCAQAAGVGAGSLAMVLIWVVRCCAGTDSAAAVLPLSGGHCPPCLECGVADPAAAIVPCASCHAAYHPECLVLPLQRLPPPGAAWYCLSCRTQAQVCACPGVRRCGCERLCVLSVVHWCWWWCVGACGVGAVVPTPVSWGYPNCLFCGSAGGADR